VHQTERLELQLWKWELELEWVRTKMSLLHKLKHLLPHWRIGLKGFA